MVTTALKTALKLAAPALVWLATTCTGLAQAPPSPGPTVPGPVTPEKPLPLPKDGGSIVINPTAAECKAGWRPELRWTREEFHAFCRQFEISK
jgi:hypothetical protein